MVTTSHSRETNRSQSLQTFYMWCTFIVAVTLLLGYSSHAIHTLLHPDSDTAPYRVYGDFYASGDAAAHHLNPYAVYPLTWRFYFNPKLHETIIYDVNLSPPCLLPFFQWLSRFPLRSGIVIWTVASTLAFILGVVLLLLAERGRLQRRKIIWLLLAQPVVNTLWLGQDYSFIFFIACLFWALMRFGKVTSACICIGILIAIKPNLGIWPIMLYVAGHKRMASVSALTAFVMSIIPVAIYGPSIYPQWLHASSLAPHYLFPGDASLIGFCTRLGFRHAGIILAVVMGLLLTIFVHRVKPSWMDASGIATCAAVLCAPLAWFYYAMVFTGPIFAASRKWGKLETWAAALLFIPPVLAGLSVSYPSKWLTLLASLQYIVPVCLMTYSFFRTGLAFRVSEDRSQECANANSVGASGLHHDLQPAEG